MKGIDQMIAEQVKRWTQREQEAQQKGEGWNAWPAITISREFGARGTALAAVLGRQTGFKVWDRALLHAIAEEGGGDERLLQSLDEHHRKAIDDAVHGALMGSQHTNTQYFRALLRVVHTIVVHGKSIVVGRGANYMSKSPTILRVRVVAPLDARVRDYTRRQALSDKEAREQVEQKDADRADFVRYHFKHDIANPADYDLVLNAATYDLEPMADIVLAAYEAKVGKRVPLLV
jgi:cytidylate kinase